MSDIPELMSVEGRGVLVGDLVNSIEFAGNPKGRRAAIEKACVAHIRAAIVQDRRHRGEAPEQVIEGYVREDL